MQLSSCKINNVMYRALCHVQLIILVNYLMQIDFFIHIDDQEQLREV